MRFAETLVEPDLIPAFDKGNAEVGGDEILRLTVLLLHDVLSIDDLGDVFSNGCIRSCRRTKADFTYVISESYQDYEEKGKRLDEPIPFWSIKPTRSASVRRFGPVVAPSFISHEVGTNVSPTWKSGMYEPFHLSYRKTSR
jgi:hypothetical protein